MAKIEQGILGPFHGTVGTVIGYRWRDRWCMRARPKHYNDRRSEAQLQQRSRFKAMIQFASPATPLLRLGLRDWASDHGLTEGNAFLKLNHACFATPTTPTSLHGITNTTSHTSHTSLPSPLHTSATINFAALRLSHGTLPPIQAPMAQRLDPLTVRVSWQRGLGRAADTLHLYAYCPAAGTGLPVAAVERSRKHTQFLLPQDFAGQEIHLWAFAIGPDGQASPTSYIPFAAEETGPDGKKENTPPKEHTEHHGQQPLHRRPAQLQLALDFASPPS